MLLFFVQSCSKEITIEDTHTEQQLVVEGYIEPGKNPIVYLTKTSKYFDKVDSSNILNYIASFAKVSVFVDDKEEVLTLKRYDYKFPIFYYEGSEIMGEVGKSYRLKVELSGKVYESTTTITNPVSLTKFSFSNPTDNPEQKFINISFNDPTEEKNFYRIYTKRIGKDDDFIPCYLSTFGDYGFNGKEMNYEIIRSYSPVINTDNGRYFVTGDSVILKFCTIEKKQYDYWKAIETQITVSSNPFGLSSSTPISLISNNALGIWGGISSKYYILKIK